MPTLTAKSQRERKVKCRGCFSDMEIQLRLDGGGDWICVNGQCKNPMRWPAYIQEPETRGKKKKHVSAR